MKLFLTGFMGAGKSAVGLRLAQKLGVGFVDLDATVEERASMPVARIFETHGEEHFRRLEHDALREVSAEARDLVIATGGGTPVRPENVRLMQARGTIVWLDPSFEAIVARLDGAERGRRPLFESAPQARALFRSREPAYATADLRVRPADDEAPDETVEKILAALGDHGPGRP